MSGLDSVLLLLGIFGVPIALLVGGHRFRRLGRRMRGAFWGGVIGYAIGILFWGVATMAPAEMWAQGSIRLSAVVMPLIIFGSAGFGIGALVGKKPKLPRHHRRDRALATAREHGSHEPGARASADS